MSKARIIIPEKIKPFIEIEHCDDFQINRYYVTSSQQELLDNIVKMKKISNELEKLNINYTNTTLLYGPTGTGKTTLGRYIAYVFDLDFAYINFSKIIDGIFGNTSRNLSEIFEFMADKECVFMLDEIDCISQKRGTESQVTGGELSRITISLMQELDKYKKKKVKSIILAATNRIDTMDEALVSRFALKHEINSLKNEEKANLIKKYLEDVGILYDEGNIRSYCSKNSIIKNRTIEQDIERCIAEWIMNGKRNFELKHSC